jgi:hypothetical protein
MQRKVIGVVLSVFLMTLPARVGGQDSRAEALQKNVAELQQKLEEQEALLNVRAQLAQAEKAKTPEKPQQDEKSKGQDQPKQAEKPQPKPGPIPIPPRVPRIVEYKVVAFRSGEGNPDEAADKLTKQFNELAPSGWEYMIQFTPQPGTSYLVFRRLKPVEPKPAESKPISESAK